MKPIYKYILCTFMALYATSCDYLEVMPDDVVTINSMFEDRYTAERYLATCYRGLLSSGNDNSNPAILGAMEMVFNKEEGWTNSRGMKIARGINSATENSIDLWQDKLYASIRVCNDFLSGIDGVDDLTKAEKERMKAEVKILKAYLHFTLLRYYGPICLMKENIPINESTTGTYSPREKIDDCFVYILQLLDEVIQSEALPHIIQNRNTELGRFTAPAAYMLKAKVLLYWASPFYNGNTEYNSFMDHNDEHFFNQTKDDARWLKAAEACDEAITICNEAGHRLYQVSDYITSQSLSKETKLVNTLRGAFSERFTCETIWGNTVHNVGFEMQKKAIPVLINARGHIVDQSLSAPFATVEKFYTKNGLPITHDKDFDMSTRYDMVKYQNNNAFPYDFEYNKRYIAMGETTAGMNYDREPRYYSTFGFDRGVWYGNTYTDPKGDAEDTPPTYVYVRNRYSEWASVYNVVNYNATGYFLKKWIPLSTSFTSDTDFRDSRFPFPEMRYADLLLMAAEAWNEVEGPTSRVIKHIDDIRNRAGLKELVESYQKYASGAYKTYPTASKDNMREVIHRERAVELSCEGSYYWDVRRWKTAKTELNKPIFGWRVLGSDASAGEYYMPTSLYVQTFSFRDYLGPIPERELINNPMLKQNPGW